MSLGEYHGALTIGLLGGFGHCVGMCGPIVGSYAVYEAERSGRLVHVIAHALYNLGRITTYTFMGALMGLTGSFVTTITGFEAFQDGASVLAGAFMFMMGLSVSGVLRAASAIEALGPRLIGALRPVLQSPTWGKYYPMGLVLGFLPCGLSYSIFAGSAAMGGPIEGGLYALSFGVGTLPAMLAAGMAASLIGARLRGTIYRMGGALVMLMGLYFIYRGVAPYVQV